MQMPCSRCAAPLNCWVNEKTCWCAALPSLPAAVVRSDTTCLCFACLAAQLDAGVVLYGIANCDTVKKARAWLTERGIAYAFWDYKKHGVPASKMSQWLDSLGRETLVNARGTTWRGLDEAAKARVVDAASAQTLLLEHASVIKRPIVAWGNTYGDAVTVGFDAALWQHTLKIQRF